jgi:putative tryptophan/tyrosine transport system substrate-binding protein
MNFWILILGNLNALARKILLTIIALLVSLYTAAAQQRPEIRRIGILADGSRKMRLEVFQHQLEELGWVEGQNVACEYRWADGNEDRLPFLAAELVRLKVDLIVVDSAKGARAVQQLTKNIPIIATFVGAGLVKSLDHPGGNLTGLSVMSPELGGKRLELLKEIIPRIYRVAVVAADPAQEAPIKEIDAVARSLSVQVQILNVKKPDEIDNAFVSIVRGNADALTLMNPAMFVLNRSKIVELAAKSRLPAMYPDSRFTAAGGLISYGPKYAAIYRRAAYFVDRILKGAKPADLPVEQPTKFELVVNLKTANQIGLTISPKVLMWADRVIE